MERARRWRWPLLALGFFALSAWLMLRGEPEVEGERRAEKVAIPRNAKQADLQRQEARRTWVAPVQADAGAELPADVPPRRDPLLAALPLDSKSSVLVVEANALRHSPAGEVLVQCFDARTRGRGLAALQEQLGLNPLQDVDRVAFWDSGALVTGNFAGVPWDKLAKGQSAKGYGQHGVLYRPGQDGLVLQPDGGSELVGTTLGRWKDQVVFVSESEEQAKEVLDRLEGRLLATGGPLSEDMAYGEAYGTLDARELETLIPDENAALRELFLKGADRVVLHLDATSDVGLLAEVQGPGGEGLSDVAKSLGAALAMARVKAVADGEEELGEFLERARVEQQPGGRFNLELAVPLELLRRKLSHCEPPSPPPRVQLEDGGT